MLLHFRHAGRPWPSPEIAPAFAGVHCRWQKLLLPIRRAATAATGDFNSQTWTFSPDFQLRDVAGRMVKCGLRLCAHIDTVNTPRSMDSTYELYGTSFVWNDDKARANVAKHGVAFEDAASVFFDPLLCVVDASRNDEARYAAIGFDDHARLLYVVHAEVDDEHLRIVSARPATREERQRYDQ